MAGLPAGASRCQATSIVVRHKGGGCNASRQAAIEPDDDRREPDHLGTADDRDRQAINSLTDGQCSLSAGQCETPSVGY
jgi:hypothetical protein